MASPRTSSTRLSASSRLRRDAMRRNAYGSGDTCGFTHSSHGESSSATGYESLSSNAYSYSNIESANEANESYLSYVRDRAYGSTYAQPPSLNVHLRQLRSLAGTIVNSALGVMDSEHVSMDGMGADYTSFGTSGDYSALLNGLNSDTSDRAYQDLVGYHEHERTRTDIDLSSYLDSSTGNSYSKLPRQHYQQ
ncbi:hypothetical protein H2203_001434 [Taxawa tesnikishii (nom. ined.)]|nr:hypothetical protein H2203_001434 [Dothideales sp. JES 119]